ncbi:MAG: glycerate kinase [Propionibacteriales bacterium]|nr:glycerate kinase [Propionibacteriales bacterium]
MRVLIAPDKFAGTLTAVHAAEAMAEGWRRHAPGDEVRCVPMADGGPGFIDVLHASLGGELLGVWTADPFDAKVPASILMVGDTAYIESAQACGRHLVDLERDDPETASTGGVGMLLMMALDEGARALVVGLGGSGTNDGGAGMLNALGARVKDEVGSLKSGARGLGGIRGVDLGLCFDSLHGARIVAATDVDGPLLGLRGATNVYGEQKGIAEERKPFIDSCLDDFANGTDRKLADATGAGAAGGLGFGLLLLGAERESGVRLVAESVELAEHAAWADVVVTGEGSFDFQSGRGKVVHGVAQVAAEALRPCVVLAGQVFVGSREMRAMGVESAYSMVELVGTERSFAQPRESLVQVSERIARTWSH